jgi:2-isopropylmalate synthase
MDTESIFDWNAGRGSVDALPGGIWLQDETLRDGLQNPSVVDPRIEDKLELIHLMDQLGIQVVNVGLPASSRRNFEHALAACREIERAKLRIRPAAAGRTVVSDVLAIAQLSQRAGMAVEAYLFIGSSPIRQLAEGWSVDYLTGSSADAIGAAVSHELPVCYVTEDTTRSRPEVLETLWANAIDSGVSRLCLTDTVGHATPNGVTALLDFTRHVITSRGVPSLGLDWHGHNDRGLSLDNALCALRNGAGRVHATALGVGERTGNTPMDLLLYNLRLLGAWSGGSEALLGRYRTLAARSLKWPEHPVWPSSSAAE